MEPQQIGFFRAYADYWKGYANFTGRTSVQGFWKAYFFVMLIQLIITIVMLVLLRQFFAGIIPSILETAMYGSYNDTYSAIYGLPAYQDYVSKMMPFTIYTYATIIPTLALMARRLRDSGQSPWWCVAMYLIPIAGFIITFVMLRRPSVPWQPPYGQGASPYGQNYGQAPYGAPAPPPYGAPAQPPYSAPAQPPYGAPAPPPYGQPAQPPYGSPAPPPYGQPAQPPYGAPAQPSQDPDAPYRQPSYAPPPPYGQQQPYGQPAYAQQPYAQRPPTAPVRCAAAVLCLWMWIATFVVAFVAVGVIVGDMVKTMVNSDAFKNGVMDPYNTNPFNTDPNNPNNPYGWGGSGIPGGSGDSAAPPVDPGNWQANLSPDELQTVLYVQNLYIEGCDELTINEVISATASHVSWYTFTLSGNISVTADGITSAGDYLHAEFQLNENGTVSVINTKEGSNDVYNQEAQALYAKWYHAALGSNAAKSM